MTRIRLNKGNLYPTDKPARAGFEDKHFESICSVCKKKLKKSDSQMSIPIKGGRTSKTYCWECGNKEGRK